MVIFSPTNFQENFMDPVCFYIGQRPIYWYGLMVATAFLAGLAHLTWLGKKTGRSTQLISDLMIVIMLGGIAGARTAYVLANWSDFAEQPSLIFRVDQGGLVYYGGLIGAILAAAVYIRLKKEALWPLADLFASALPLGHAIGRIGCFLNGCCYGCATSLPWGVALGGVWRHPVQLYEALANLLLYLWFLRAYPRRRRDGQILAQYLVLYPLIRFFMEFVRGDERLHWLGLNLAQDISLVLMLGGVILGLLFSRQAASSN